MAAAPVGLTTVMAFARLNHSLLPAIDKRDAVDRRLRRASILRAWTSTEAGLPWRDQAIGFIPLVRRASAGRVGRWRLLVFPGRRAFKLWLLMRLCAAGVLAMFGLPALSVGVTSFYLAPLTIGVGMLDVARRERVLFGNLGLDNRELLIALAIPPCLCEALLWLVR